MKILCQCGRTRERKQSCTHCNQNKRQSNTDYEKKKAAYKTRTWQKTSLTHRSENPLCVHCLRTRKYTNIHPKDGRGCVDHIEGFTDANDPQFMNTKNHQGLCWPCHDNKTLAERTGKYTDKMIDRDKSERLSALIGVGGRYSE